LKKTEIAEVAIMFMKHMAKVKTEVEIHKLPSKNSLFRNSKNDIEAKVTSCHRSFFLEANLEVMTKANPIMKAVVINIKEKETKSATAYSHLLVSKLVVYVLGQERTH